MKSLLFRLALPTSTPSMGLLCAIWCMLFGFVLPPYMILVCAAVSAVSMRATSSLIASVIYLICSIVAAFPVPIAHTGSYAMIVCLLRRFCGFPMLFLSCCLTNRSALPCSRSSASSPIQTIGVRFALYAALTFAVTCSLVSP